MTRSQARKIAEKITNTELKELFDKAKVEIKDWRKISIVNKAMTKGFVWNILAKDFDVNKSHHILAKTNMVMEFGEFLPDNLKPFKEPKQKIVPTHQEPIF